MSHSRSAILSAKELSSLYGVSPPRDRAPNKELSELTPSAKFIGREVRRLLTQRQAAAEEPSGSEASSPPATEQEVIALIRQAETAHSELLSDRERTSLTAHLVASFDDYDILTSLVQNPEINDIIVRSFDDISVQTRRRNIQTSLSFRDRDTYKAFVDNLLKRAGKSCTTAQPIVDAALGADVRACVTHESLSPGSGGPMLTMRVLRHRRISLDTLSSLGCAPAPVLDYLAALMRSGQHTILLAGEVGSGKTTMARALTQSISADESILVIEDTHEIVLDRPFVRTLLTREANVEGIGRVPPSQAIKAGMRMAMNRLVLGEIRDPEAAEAFIDVCSSGHAGLSTIHAKSAKDALNRLELFLSRAQPRVGIDTVRRQIANSVSAIVYLGLDSATMTRRVLEVCEIAAFGDGVIQISPLFRFANRTSGPVWLRESGLSRFTESLQSAGVLLPLPGAVLAPLNEAEHYQ